MKTAKVNTCTFNFASLAQIPSLNLLVYRKSGQKTHTHTGQFVEAGMQSEGGWTFGIGKGRSLKYPYDETAKGWSRPSYILAYPFDNL